MIEQVLPELRQALLEHPSAILQAPPGAGKTTVVPLALLEEPWLTEKRIVMLEPRRLAARAAAYRMASLLGEPVGRTVGYRVRLDNRIGPETRIEVVTEGILTRMMQSDPALEGTGLVIFDEFHERSMHADLALALSLECRSLLRPDLKILVMSATLDGERVAGILDIPPIITGGGKGYPVDNRYLEHGLQGRIEDEAARIIRRALTEEEGDLLVFLPGAGEIRRVETAISGLVADLDVRIHPLYGNLPPDAQDAAIRPRPDGRRKVVLATSIAETSITIEGVRIVIDSGLMRVPRFSPDSGMTRLVTIPVSRASADQRRGRAGRLGPGICYRLWTRHFHQHLHPHTTPEILEADLAPLALDLALWGVHKPSDLKWLDEPPTAAYQQAVALLRHLGAVDDTGRISSHGREMASLGTHPRLAHMVLKGRELGHGALACELAALLGERDIFRSHDGVANADVRLRLEVLSDNREHLAHARGYEADRAACQRVMKAAKQWKKDLECLHSPRDIEAAGELLALAYPDRIGRLRPGASGRFVLRNGRSAFLSEPQLLSDSPFIVAANLDGQRNESRIFLAAPVDESDVRRLFSDDIAVDEVVEWDPQKERVEAVRREGLGAIILKELPLSDPPPARITRALLEAIGSHGLEMLPWDMASRRLQQRIQFVRKIEPDFPDASDEMLRENLEEWLAPFLIGRQSRADLAQLNLCHILMSLLSWDQQKKLDRLAPTHIVVPSGSEIVIDYSDAEAPVLAVRLQEMFGLAETPRIGKGVPLTLHLLSPAHRPVQVTQDLASFWGKAYFDVKRDLKGRYPKHYWPDDPLTAPPTSRAKRRR